MTAFNYESSEVISERRTPNDLSPLHVAVYKISQLITGGVKRNKCDIDVGQRVREVTKRKSTRAKNSVLLDLHSHNN